MPARIGGRGGAGRGSADTAEVRPVWSRSAHWGRLATLAVTALVIAIITGRPEFAGVAAPAVLLLAVRRPARPGQIRVRPRLSAAAVTEGEEATLDVAVSGCEEHSVQLAFQPRQAVVPHTADTAPGSSSLPFHVSQSGRGSLGTLHITLWDRWRLSQGQAAVSLPEIDCYPAAAALASRVVLSRLPNWLGEHASRMAGEGIEFTGIREAVPGDRQRRINWPATTRRGQLQLNTFAAERAQTVVIIADVSTRVGEPGATPADIALRGAAGAADAYLGIRDRVGFILYQHGVSWLAPGTGARHRYRILDMMVRGADAARLRRQESVITSLPRAALPPGSLVLVFSPLVDQRIVETVRNLCERGFTTLIIDVLNTQPGDADRLSGLARRIWQLEQAAIRFSLRELGIPVVAWDGTQRLDQALAPYTRTVLVTR